MKKTLSVAAVLGAFGVVLVLSGMALVEAGPFSESVGTSPPSPSPSPRDVGPVIATVNGLPIHLGEIEARVEGMTDMHRGDLEETLGEDWPDDILQNVVDDRIVEMHAEALGITVTEDDVTEAMDRLRGYFGSEQDFEAWLEEGLMDEAELRDRVRLQVLTTEVFRSVTEDVTVSTDEARRWFEGHPGKYPGLDGEGVPFYSVKDQVKEDVLTDKREDAYAVWLDAQREVVEVVVVDDGWWKELQ